MKRATHLPHFDLIKDSIKYRLESEIWFYEVGIASMVYLKESRPEYKSRDYTNRPSIAEILYFSNALTI